jgi:hypothetical protein
MINAARRAPKNTTYRVSRRGGSADGWREVGRFHDLHEAGDSIDQAVARGEGELDDYRIDAIPPPVQRRWYRPSTWR